MSQNSENNFPRHPRQYNPYDSDSTLLMLICHVFWLRKDDGNYVSLIKKSSVSFLSNIVYLSNCIYEYNVSNCNPNTPMSHIQSYPKHPSNQTTLLSVRIRLQVDLLCCVPHI